MGSTLHLSRLPDDGRRPTALNTPLATTVATVIHSMIALTCQSITRLFETPVTARDAKVNIVCGASGVLRPTPGAPAFPSKRLSLRCYFILGFDPRAAARDLIRVALTREHVPGAC